MFVLFGVPSVSNHLFPRFVPLPSCLLFPVLCLVVVSVEAFVLVSCSSDFLSLFLFLRIHDFALFYFYIQYAFYLSAKSSSFTWRWRLHHHVPLFSICCHSGSLFLSFCSPGILLQYLFSRSPLHRRSLTSLSRPFFPLPSPCLRRNHNFIICFDLLAYAFFDLSIRRKNKTTRGERTR